MKRSAGLRASVGVVVAVAVGVASAPVGRALAVPSPSGSPEAAGVVSIQAIDAEHLPQVVLHVSVVDAGGHRVPGLRASDFGVTEGGQPVEGTTVRRVPASGTSLGLVLAIDRSGSMSGPPIEAAKRAAIDAAHHLSADDRLGVLTFGAGTRWVVRPTTPEAVRASRIGAIEATDDSTFLFDATLRSAHEAAALPTDRHAVILVTDGADEGSRSTLAGVLAGIPDDTVVDTIGLPSDSSDPGPIRAIAHRSGGTFVAEPATPDLVTVYRRLARSLRSEYQISYRSSRPAGGPTDVVVTARFRGETLTATGTYGTGTPAAPSPSPGAGPTRAAGSGGGSLVWILAAAVALLIVAVVAMFMWARRRTRRPMPFPGTATGEGGFAAVRAAAAPPVPDPVPLISAGQHQDPIDAPEVGARGDEAGAEPDPRPEG